MSLKNQRRIAAEVLKCSPHRIRFEPARLGDIEEAITKSDIKGFVNEGVIQKKAVTSISRGRARRQAHQKHRGQRKGQGSRKGARFSRLGRKEVWILRIRSQRKLLRELRERGEIDGPAFRMLYLKAKGSFFRNKRHIKLYLEEQGLVKK